MPVRKSEAEPDTFLLREAWRCFLVHSREQKAQTPSAWLVDGEQLMDK